MNDGKSFFDNIQKIARGQGDDFTTGALLNYHYLNYYKIIRIDLSKRQALDADPKASILLQI